MRFLPKTARKQVRRNSQQSSLELVRERVVSQEIRAKIKRTTSLVCIAGDLLQTFKFLILLI